MAYASYGFKIIRDDEDNLKGINFGYGFKSEHEHGYNGRELREQKKGILQKLKKEKEDVFKNERVKNANEVKLIEVGGL